MRNPYSPPEDKFISDCAQVMTSKQIGKLLGRTGESIKCRARRIGVKLIKRGENHHNAIYSDKDIELVRQLAEDGTLTLKEIAEKMEIGFYYVVLIVSCRTRV